MYTIGLSSCSKELNRELFEQYQKAGIGAMELSYEREEYALLDFEEVGRLAKEYSVTLWSLHLPFGPFEEIDLSRRETRAYTLAYYEELIRKGSEIGIKTYVVHPSAEPIADAERRNRMDCAKESLALLAETAKKYGAIIAVEDLPRSCLGRNAAEIQELISAHSELRVCFDTNHLLNEDPVDFIYAVGDKIITTHVSDYDFVNERHWLPGEGKLDWNGVIKALKEVGYKGVWLYEIGFACPNTILRDRALVCADFVRNANELFTGKPITVFSNPKPNLGMWE